jgi:hypothetical protein
MLTRPFATLLAAATFATTAHAWFRLACTTPLVSERVDPIINPGQSAFVAACLLMLNGCAAGVIPSQHAHTIHGGAGFSQNYTFNALRASTCSDCEVKQDMSACSALFCATDD